MTARELARRVLDRVDRGGAWATLTLDGELGRAGLDDRDRRLASELVYGVLRQRARLDRALAAHADLARTPPKVRTALRVAAYQLLFLDRVPAYAAVDDAVGAARAAGGGKLAGFCNAVLRKVVAQREPALPPGGAPGSPAQLARLEVEHSLPRWILDELAAAVAHDDALELTAPPRAPDGDAPDRRDREAEGGDPAGAAGGAGAAAADGAGGGVPRGLDRLAALAAAFGQPAPLVARANRRRTTRAALAEHLTAAGVTATPIEVAPMALRLDGLGDPARSPSFVAGKWTVQDTGAQLVGELAAEAARAAQATRAAGAPLRILDACAGVGGKATHLAEAIDGAEIDAADQSRTKLALLEASAARLGLAGIRTHTCDLLDPAAWSESPPLPSGPAARSESRPLPSGPGAWSESPPLPSGPAARSESRPLPSGPAAWSESRPLPSGPAALLGAAYDLVLLDAPCSGLGVLRRHPDAKWRLTADAVPRLAHLQAQLLDAVTRRLAPGGTLIYAVCTFTRAEGPDQIAALLARAPSLRLVAAYRTWPPGADAFYVARLAKAA